MKGKKRLKSTGEKEVFKNHIEMEKRLVCMENNFTQRRIILGGKASFCRLVHFP